MGGSVDTGSSTTKSANPDVERLVSTLSKGIGSAYKPGGTTYVAPGANTTGSWNAALGAAGNTDFSGGISGALKSYSNRAAGNELGLDDPLYAAQRARLTDDVLTQSKNAFNLSGLLGSDQNQYHAGRGLADALGGLDLAQRAESYGRQAEAATMLPQLFQNSLMPSSVMAGIGAAQDADAAAKQNGGIDYLQQFTNLLQGASGAAGTTTTEKMPWWKVGLGTAATLGSLL